MPSIISAGTTVGTALSLTSDTSGELQIRTNNGATTAMTLTTGGAAVFTAGTVSAPSITTTGDTNTGIFFPAADTIAFTEGGVEGMRITSAGNLGIGTSSPTAKLTINTGASAGLHIFRSDANANFDAIVFRNSANNANQSKIGWNGNDLRFESTSNTLFETNGAERMRIDTNGNLVLGSSSSSFSRFQSNRTVAPTAYNDANIEMITASGGNVLLGFHSAGVSAVCLRHQSNVEAIQARNLTDSAFIAFQASAFTVSSDYRLKENIVPLTAALERLSNLPVHRFNFRPVEEIGDNYGTATVDGLLAHEVAAVVPEAAFGAKDAVKEDGSPLYQSVDLAKLVPLLAASIQELKAELDSVKAELQTLKGA